MNTMSQERIKVLEDLKLIETLMKVPVVIRNYETISMGNGLPKTMAQIGIVLDTTKPIHVNDFRELLKEKGIDLEDMKRIKINRKIKIRDERGT